MLKLNKAIQRDPRTLQQIGFEVYNRRYIHKWFYPIVVLVRGHGHIEYWYYAPYYNPRHLPVVIP